MWELATPSAGTVELPALVQRHSGVAAVASWRVNQQMGDSLSLSVSLLISHVLSHYLSLPWSLYYSDFQKKKKNYPFKKIELFLNINPFISFP